MCEKCNCPPTGKQLEHAIRRNFGGYFNTYEIFINHIGNLSNDKDTRSHDKQVKPNPV